MNELSQFLVDGILLEESEIKRIIVVYSGRFQPFHSGHYDSYSKLVKKFGKDNVYIGTSNVVSLPKSPFNFKEKVEIMTTMFNIPKSKIVQVKNPYAPKEILSKYNDKNTAYVTFVSDKDGSRLVKGKYFYEWDGNPTIPYRDGGYVYMLPPGGGGLSGTEVRDTLKSGSDTDKKRLFTKLYPKFNQKIFDLITSKITEETIHISKEIVEEWVITHLPKVLKEASITGGFGEVDDGPNFFFRDFRVFDKVSKRRAEQIGYEVVKQIMDASFQDLTVYPEYPNGPVKAVTPFPAGVIGKVTATNQKDFGSDRAYDLWFKHARRVATIVGYSLVRDKDEIERRLAVSSAKDIYTDETIDEPSSVNESTFFTKEELNSITDDIMNELGGLMIGYAGKDDIEKKQKQLNKLRKKLDKTTPNYSAVKETYDKLEFYLNYYKNLTPSGFSVDKQNNNIVISLNPINESDMGKTPYVVDIDNLTINNTDFRNTKWTGENLQMTVMSIDPNQNIGVEVHTDGDQFLRVEDGEGEVHMGKTKENLDYIKKIKDDTAIFIPAGFWHDIKNTSSTPLKLYAIYAPVEHPKGKVDTVKPIEEVITEAQSKLKLNIPQSVRKIHSAFKKSGKKLYVVGGAVRDAILGKSPKDFDLATDAKPDEVIQIAQKNGFRYTEVGKAFGVVVIDDMEIATFRADIGKGRRPDSVEYTDIYGDVLRRDLTINALFYDLDKGEIVDLVGGIKDLQKNKIRTVGNAIERFDEDPLRKLRAIRFAARLGGKLDKSTLEAIVADPTLKGVSEERIRDEFIKSIQSAKSVVDYLKVMSGTKLLHQCFPNMTWKTSDFIEEKNPIILLAYLFRRNTPQNLYKQLMRLKYSHDESNAVKFLIELSDFKPENVFKLKKQQQNTVLGDADILRWGKLIGTNFTKFVRFNLTVKGDDVMKMGKRGAEIGKEIERLETQRFLSESVKNKGIKTFRDLFNQLPTDLQKRVYNLKKIAQRPDFHPEGNTLKHTIVVVNRALKSDDMDLAISAILHDIGKDETEKINPKTGQPSHHGHEEVSAQLAKKHTDWIESMGGNVANIYYIIRNHMRVKQFDVMRKSKQNKLKAFRAFDKLDKFKTYDRGGLGEDITIPVNVGDTILTGRFKNKKTKVTTIGKDDRGMPTVNGRKVVNFRMDEADELTEAEFVLRPGFKFVANKTVDNIKKDWWYIIDKIEGKIGNMLYHLKPLNRTQPIQVSVKSPAELYAKILR